MGWCGLAYGDRGIVRVVLPQRSRRSVENSLQKDVKGVVLTDRVPADVRRIARRIAEHLGGKPDALGDVTLDLTNVGGFRQKVYRMLRKVRPGRVVTYGELADAAGNPGAARAVGRAMASNPVPLLVPCHRVLGADGKLTGFSAAGGLALKARILKAEGVETRGKAR
jgi:methylated-DNA-[protein]-cysteine S-methyltransferase